jgi:16S rRNA (cytidine1402-2'-O)-methyltransferase
MKDLAPLLAERPIIIARELTKVHQSFLRGRAHDIILHLQQVKGEITIVVGPGASPNMLNDQSAASGSTAAVEYFGRLAQSGGATRRQAISMAAQRFGLSAKSVYRAVEEAKRSAK